MVRENNRLNPNVNGFRGAAIAKTSSFGPMPGKSSVLEFMARSQTAQRNNAPNLHLVGSRGSSSSSKTVRRKGGRAISTSDEKDVDLGDEDSSSSESDYEDEISEEDLAIEVADDEDIEYDSTLDELEIHERQLNKKAKAKKGKKRGRESDTSSDDEPFEVEASDEELEKRFSKKRRAAGITAAQLISGEKVFVSDDESDTEEEKLPAPKQEKKLPCIIPEDVDLDDPHFLVVFHRFCDESLTVDESRTEFMAQLKTYCVHPGTVAHSKFLSDYRGRVHNGRRLTKNSECDLLFTALFNNATRLLTKYATYRRRNRAEMSEPPDEALYLGLFTDDEEEEEELSGEEEEEEEEVEKAEKKTKTKTKTPAPPAELTWKEISSKARAPATNKNSVEEAISHVHGWVVGELPQNALNYKLVSTWKRLVRSITDALPLKSQRPMVLAQLNILEQPDTLRSLLPHYKYLTSLESFRALVSRLHSLAHPYLPIPEQL